MFKTQVEPKPQASGFTAKFHFLWSIRVKTMESFSWHVLSSIFGEVQSLENRTPEKSLSHYKILFWFCLCIEFCPELYIRSTLAGRLVINPRFRGVILGAYPPGCAAFAGVSPNVVADESVMKTDEGMRMEQRYTVVSFLLQSTILFWL